jgi:hypothetical protein
MWCHRRGSTSTGENSAALPAAPPLPSVTTPLHSVACHTLRSSAVANVNSGITPPGGHASTLIQQANE